MSGLPDIDGREAVRILRKNGFKAPIIMLTGHDTDSDTILGLESGANDYVTKPFRFAVLLARIRAQLRQHEASEDAVFTIGPYTFRPSSKLLLSPKGNKVRLTEKETAILRYLYRAGQRPVSRESPAAGGLGLQFRRHHPHARDPHLPAAPEGREGRRHAGDPGDRSRRLQAGAVSGSRHRCMTIEDDIAFLERVPSLAMLGRDALRILAIGAESRYVHGGEVLFTAGDPADAGYVIQDGSFTLTVDSADTSDGRDDGDARHAAGRARAAHRDDAAGHRDRRRALDRDAHPAQPVPQDAGRLSRRRRRLRDYIATRTDQAARDMIEVRAALDPDARR